MGKKLTPLEVSKQLKDFIFELELGNVDKLFVKGSFEVKITNLEDEKKLKALEIIKEKGIDILEFRATRKAKTYNENTKRVYVKDYTDEEYDLLKEVLL